MENVAVIAFDADDTLWSNEPYFRAVEDKFCVLLEDYMPMHSISRELLKIEIANLDRYGYGIKSFMLSMIEAAIVISEGTIPIKVISQILELGKEMLDHDVVLLDGVEDVLSTLQGKYRLVLATKGDLLDQQRKLDKSGLSKYFHHIEVMSEKNEKEYSKILKHMDIEAHQFAMVGNSLKSDVLPVLSLGGYGFHIPFHAIWEMEKVDINIAHDKFRELTTINEILNIM